MITVQTTNWGDSIFLALSNALNTFLAAIPNIVGAVLIIAIGWITAGVVARVVTGGLRRVGADRLFAEHGAAVTSRLTGPRQGPPDTSGVGIAIRRSLLPGLKPLWRGSPGNVAPRCARHDEPTRIYLSGAVTP